MLGKLAYRNMKRSAKDYLIYILTMTVVSALMYAFNSLIFQNEFTGMMEEDAVMPIMIGLATFFIVLIMAWLIHYMIRFMMEKRGSEFGIYMLLGMKKRTIASLYVRENLLLGSVALIIGCGLGILLSQILMSIMASMIYMEYVPHVTFNHWTILMTVLCYGGCYFLALFRCKRRFRKMNIHDLMESSRKNEEIKEGHEGIKKLLFPLSVLFILLFWTVFTHLTSTGEIVLFIIGLVLTIYLFYMGLSAWITCYVRKKGKGIYRGQNLFLLRQFASKVRTMQFTMGTLTALFTLALMGASLALVFSDYEDKILPVKFPFDVLVNSTDPEDNFEDEREILEKYTDTEEMYTYHIYTDEGNQVNTWMLTNLEQWGDMYRKNNGSSDMKKIQDMLKNGGTYCTYDTYMGITDYNHLREMLGYEPVSLRENEYAVQIKDRLKDDAKNIGKDLKITDKDGEALLSFGGLYTDAFSQDGHNGGDYLVIVPDRVLERMTPYYAEMAADIKGKAPADLQKRLENLTEEEREFDGDAAPALEGNSCIGSDNMVVYAAVNLVRDNCIPEVKVLLASVMLPMFYIGLVFVCVAVTVLSVQQLSDSAKYKFRYDVLEKMGLKQKEICKIIRIQLAAYYLCPALLAIVISGKLILTFSNFFVRATGVTTSFPGIYFGKSIVLFMGIYIVYYIVTYVVFKRNVFLKKFGQK
ncbi:MAG: FtsX-like permease family protein [Eubacteriales bacterium]|nr:FtsX-like permease family protein [Eubacteriales bacterium]